MIDRIYVEKSLFSHVQDKVIYDYFEKTYFVKNIEKMFDFFSKM